MDKLSIPHDDNVHLNRHNVQDPGQNSVRVALSPCSDAAGSNPNPQWWDIDDLFHHDFFHSYFTLMAFFPAFLPLVLINLKNSWKLWDENW